MAKIAFYKGKPKQKFRQFLNFLILFWTRGEYTHVEYIDDSDPNSWDWYSASAFEEGYVRKKNIFIHEDHWDVFDINIEIDNEKVIEFFNKEMGKPYDWIGIYFSQFLPLNKENPKKWFCSEIVAKSLQIGNPILMKNIQPSRVSPNNLYKYLSAIGFLKEYDR
jgi:hypothetical protein